MLCPVTNTRTVHTHPYFRKRKEKCTTGSNWHIILRHISRKRLHKNIFHEVNCFVCSIGCKHYELHELGAARISRDHVESRGRDLDELRKSSNHKCGVGAESSKKQN